MGRVQFRLGTAVKDRWSLNSTYAQYQRAALSGLNFRINISESSVDGAHGRIRQELDQVRRIRLMPRMLPGIV